jgi:molybdopterin molybdotransferase
MISVGQAKAILQKHIPPRKVILVPLEKAIGLICAADVNSPMHVPSFDNSAMDGYAIAWEEGKTSWELEGEIAAGAKDIPNLSSGKAIRIFTGAPIPDGADTVIQQEWITVEDGKISLQTGEIIKGMHVRKKGAQTQSGDIIMQAGTAITPGGIGLLASVGIQHVSVVAPPSVGIIITGNEIKEVGQPLEHGEIYNANGPLLTTYLQQEGIEAIECIRVEDNPDMVRQAITKALAIHDLILLSGGISVGDYDFVKEGLEQAGVQELFYKIKQKPGKPLYAGIKDKQMVFALPGNPASVITCFNQYVKPSIRQWMGKKPGWEPSLWLPLNSPVKKNPNLTFFLKIKTHSEEVEILQGQESFNLIAFSIADGFAEIPEGVEAMEKGEKVGVYLW